MALIGITLDTTREYVSDLDPAKGSDEATVFVLGTLDSRIFGMIRDKATTMSVDPTDPNGEVNTTINVNEVAFTTAMYGLKGWKNFRDGKGNDIKFATIKRTHGNQSYTVVDPEVLKRLPSVVIMELAEQIKTDNDVSEDAAKN